VNPPEAQSDCESQYFDPESPDMSEQQFSASLDVATERPTFVVDEGEGAAPQVEAKPAASEFIEGREQTAAAPDCDAAPHADGSEADEAISDPVISSPQDAGADPDWRNQISAKINKYRSRKPHQTRFPSLQLKFEQSPRRGTLAAESGLDAFPPSEFPAPENATFQPEIPICPDATARVLEFPRSAALPVRQDELADPVMDRPRIVEAPELLPPPPALGGILIEPVEAPAPERRKGFDLPLQTAAISRRLCAAAIDALVVLSTVALFGAVAVRIAGPLPLRTAYEVATILAALLWAGYQYSLLVYSGTTPGLWLAKLAITRFDGTRAPRKLRRWRVLASFLSFIPLGLGYLWCFLDEDQLSWHDRITKTHLGPRPVSVR
jgi:uncharacterized RDD family membrane protein YckC